MCYNSVIIIDELKWLIRFHKEMVKLLSVVCHLLTFENHIISHFLVYGFDKPPSFG